MTGSASRFHSSLLGAGLPTLRRVLRRDVAGSCGSVHLCAAISDTGKLLVSDHSHSQRSIMDRPRRQLRSGPHLGGCVAIGGTFWDVSCVNRGAGLCVAVGDGELAASSNPAGGSSAWPIAPLDRGHSFTGVSCTTTSMCAAIDDAGHVATSTHPPDGTAAWHTVTIDSHRGLTDVTCVDEHGCAAIDRHGDVLTSADPGARNPSWRLTRVDNDPLMSITCTTTGTCLTVDDHRRAVHARVQ